MIRRGELADRAIKGQTSLSTRPGSAGEVGPALARAAVEPDPEAIRDLETHPQPLVTVEQLARYWQVHPRTVRRAIYKRALAAIRLGSAGPLRIRIEDARKFGRIVE
jgi:hypothetical protein